MKKTIILPILLMCACTGRSTFETPFFDYGDLTDKKTVTGPKSAVQEQPIQELTLEKAFRLCEQFHPNLEAARAKIEAAEGRMLQAGLFLNPELVARIESLPGHSNNPSQDLIGLTQRIPIGGRISWAQRVAELELGQLVKEFDAKRLEVRFKVHGAFATALYLTRSVQILKDALQNAESGVKIAKARVDAGEALPDELARAELEQIKIRLELKREESMQNLAIEAIKVSIGNTALKIEAIKGDLEATIDIPALEVLVMKMAESSILASAELDIKIQRARLELAKSETIPDVNLDLVYRRYDFIRQNTFDLGVGIALPLFDRSQGKLKEARSDIDKAEAQLAAKKNELYQHICETHAKLTRALESAKLINESILPKSKNILKSTEVRYKAGDISFMETLVIRRDHISYQLQYLEALRDVMQEWAELSFYVKLEK